MISRNLDKSYIFISKRLFVIDRVFHLNNTGNQVPETPCLIPDDVTTRIEEREGTLGDSLAVSFEAGIGFGEGIPRLVAFVPLHVMDQRGWSEAGMQGGNNLPQPLRERIGADAVVDFGEVFERVPFEDVRVLKMELLSLIVQLNDGFDGRFIEELDGLSPYQALLGQINEIPLSSLLPPNCDVSYYKLLGIPDTV